MELVSSPTPELNWAAPAARSSPSTSRLSTAGIHLMFFASGVASLMCEIVWFKQLQFVLGSSTFAVTVVIACFFGGLAVGSWLAGRLADRVRNTLQLYGLLELGLGLASATVTLVLSAWQTWTGWLAPWLGPDSSIALPLTLACSLVVLILPTALMGATLPVLSRYLVKEGSSLAQRIGVLYGLNTLGAATGCALVGFLFIGWLGVIQTALLASAIYGLIGLSAISLQLSAIGYRQRQARCSVLAESRETTADCRLPVAGDRAAGTLIIVFALSGFTSIAYEVLWFRILTCFGIHSVYAFSAMLAVYLVGLVLGSFICARYLAPHRDRHLVYFARLQLLVAAGAIVSLALLGRSRNILEAVVALEQWLGLQDVLHQTIAGVSPIVWLSLIVLLIPTTLIGIGLPLAVELTTHRIAILGTRLGSLYSLNTLGGVLGSLVTGFVLLPLLGSQWSFLLMVLLNFALFAVVMASQPGLRPMKSLWREGGVTAVALIACFAALGPGYLRDAQSKWEGARIMAFEESADATFIVLEYESDHVGRFQQLLVNGKSYANNAPPGRRYMGVLGHLPALLHAEPKDSLVICVGTGTTVGALTLHPSIEHIAAVDLSRHVFNVAPFFVPLNHRFPDSPKVRPVVADGRHFLLCDQRQYDVLTFEPPPPSDAGVVNLYSQEFYQLAKRRMKPGAVLCQWVPLDLPREALPRMMLQALRAEFPHVSLWIPSRMEGVAIASMEPLRIDPTRLRERLSDPRVQSDLQAYGMGELEQVLATFLAADDDLSRLIGDAPLVTDNRPRIEYFNFYPSRVVRYEELLTFRRLVTPHLSRPRLDPAEAGKQLQVITHIWLNHQAASDENWSEARRHAEAALRLDPANRYARYLLADADEQARNR
jgi:spermidine synthase